MKKLVVLLLVSLMATSAFATIDPDNDMLGVYFDANNDMNSTALAASTPMTMNFVITRAQNDIYGVEFGYRVATVPAGSEGSVFRLAETYPTSGLNVGNSSSVTIGDYIVGYGSPIPVTVGNDYTVVSWNVMLLAPVTVEIYVGPSSVPSIENGLPAYEIGGTILPLGVSTGYPAAGYPAAVINGESPVATEDVSFGSVKSLFR